MLAPDGTTVRPASLHGNQVGFTGRFLDKETGLWYFRARYYSGSLGRFTGRDPGLAKVKRALEAKEGAIPDGMSDLPAVEIVMQPYGDRGYHDGMNLYSGYFCPNGTDPSGLACKKKCGYFYVQNPELVGHAWLEGPGGLSAGFYPNPANDPLDNKPGVINIPDPHALKPTPGDTRVEYGTCDDCTSCPDPTTVALQLKAIQRTPPNYCFPIHTCRDWAKDTLSALGLCPCD